MIETGTHRNGLASNQPEENFLPLTVAVALKHFLDSDVCKESINQSINQSNHCSINLLHYA